MRRVIFVRNPNSLANKQIPPPVIIFNGHLTTKNANVDTFCQNAGGGKFPKIFRFWCSMTLFRLVIFKARSSYRKHKQTLVVQDNGVLKEGHTAFQLIPGLK